MKRDLDWWVTWTAVAVAMADWATKIEVHSRISFHEVVEVFDGWLYLVHRQNTGVAFGLLGETDAFWRTPFLVAAIMFAVVVLVHMARTAHNAWVRAATALMLGGAVGNLLDRLGDGGVTDFVLVTFFPYVFNVADAAITVGGVLLAFSYFAMEPAPAEAHAPAPELASAETISTQGYPG